MGLPINKQACIGPLLAAVMVLTLAMAPAPAWSADVAGYWRLHLVFADGDVETEIWNISQTGDDLTADRNACLSCYSFAATGTSTGSAVTFTIPVGPDTATAVGTVSGGTMTGTFTVGDPVVDSGTFSAVSTTTAVCSEAASPAQVVDHLHIDLTRVSGISRFRSGEGHDFSDAFECCRSMKHYFHPRPDVDPAAIKIYSPVDGTVVSIEDETMYGKHMRIRRTGSPAMIFMIFHMTPLGGISAGDPVSAGQQVGTHFGSGSDSDLAVKLESGHLVSIFEVLTDRAFRAFQARGLVTREMAIISKAERDADLLDCPDGFDSYFSGPGSIENLVDFYPPAVSVMDLFLD